MFRELAHYYTQNILQDPSFLQDLLRYIPENCLEYNLGSVCHAVKLSGLSYDMEEAMERFRRYGDIFKEAGCNRNTVVTWISERPTMTVQGKKAEESISWVSFVNEEDEGGSEGIIGAFDLAYLEKNGGGYPLFLSLFKDNVINFADKTIADNKDSEEYTLWTRHFCELMLLAEVWANNRKMIYVAEQNMFVLDIMVYLEEQRMQNDHNSTAVRCNAAKNKRKKNKRK